MARKMTIALLASVLLVGGIVWAEATKTPVEGTHSVEVVGAAERHWVDDEGIEHYRGLPMQFHYPTGDLEGTGWGEININLDPMGNGDESGSGTWDLTWGDLSGTFEGRFTATVTYGVSNGSVVLQGTSGDFVGMKVIVTTQTYYGTFTGNYQGIILDPQGE